MSRSLVDALAGIPPPPCQDCPWAEACAEAQLACRDFARYIEGKRHGDDVGHRAPTAKVFKRLFPEVSDE